MSQNLMGTSQYASKIYKMFSTLRIVNIVNVEHLSISLQNKD